MSKHQEILGAVLGCPQSIPFLYKTHNKEVLTHTLYSLLPRRIGIEIECAGSLLYNHVEKWTSLPEYGNNNILRYLEKHYKVFNLRVDGNTPDYAKDNHTLDNNVIEHRISILGYSQLIGLYNILEDMKKTCIHTDSGIHIHVDCSDIFTNWRNAENMRSREDFIESLKDLFRTQLDTIETIFGEYKGTYNSKSVLLEAKGGWVNIRPSMNTIEFRIAPLTFDYTTIVTWCIELNKLIMGIKNNIPKQFNKQAKIKRFSKYHHRDG